MLIINMENRPETEEHIYRALHKQSCKVRSKIIKQDKVELSMEVRLKRNNLSITDSLQEISGVKDVTLVQYRGSYEA